MATSNDTYASWIGRAHRFRLFAIASSSSSASSEVAFKAIFACLQFRRLSVLTLHDDLCVLTLCAPSVAGATRSQYSRCNR